MNPNIQVPRDRVAAFCRAHGITQLAIFGSALREDFGTDSDIDILVEFAPGCTPGLKFVGIASELSDLFGREVDVLTRTSVEQSRNYIRRKAILDSAEVIYAA
ncbi:MAG: nucleotidyltransferase family protein [Gammaproteobacteria bacterium]|nr:nucleotidyltransferase family protein [Gammaproteobacteria bacterium]